MYKQNESTHNNNVIFMFYINLFLFSSILGFSYETIFRLIHHYSTYNLLLGPWMPIYGFGILIVEGIDKTLNFFQIKGKKKVFLNLLLSVFFITILEWIGGILVEKLFSTSFWNYESIPLHIGPYISILISIIWGIMAMFLEYFFTPICTPLLKKIPNWISFLLLLLLLLDHICLIFRFKLLL